MYHTLLYVVHFQNGERWVIRGAHGLPVPIFEMHEKEEWLRAIQPALLELGGRATLQLYGFPLTLLSLIIVCEINLGKLLLAGDYRFKLLFPGSGLGTYEFLQREFNKMFTEQPQL